jgi:lysophospholipase L1-like esterase
MIKIICVTLLVFVVIYINSKVSYSEEYSEELQQGLSTSVTTIAIMGDSWVAGNKLDSMIQKQLTEQGIQNKILSFGHPGGTTKDLYKDLCGKGAYMFTPVITTNPDYCIIIAGVNDAASKVGADFYSYHMLLIIKTLLKYDIKPIIVSLPEFGIEETFYNMDLIRKIRTGLIAVIKNKGEINCIATYRKTLFSDLGGLKNRIAIIDFDKVCSDYSTNKVLYDNPSHLSTAGRKKLVKEISKAIIKEDKCNIMD